MKLELWECMKLGMWFCGNEIEIVMPRVASFNDLIKSSGLYNEMQDAWDTEYYGQNVWIRTLDTFTWLIAVYNLALESYI